jgi:hypothetical protein
MPVGGRIFGVCAFIFGVLFIVAAVRQSLLFAFLSPILIIIGIACFATTHLIIDKSDLTITELTKCLGRKFITTLDLKKFVYVSIISQLYKETSRTTIRQDMVNEYRLYDIILLSKSHLGKYKVVSATNIEDAKREAQKLSDYLNFDIVKFAPVRTRQK